MDKIHLKNLIRRILEVKSSLNKRDNYLYRRLFPAILMRDEERVGQDKQSGTIYIVAGNIMFNNKSWRYVYATPFWQEAKGIPIAVGDDGTATDGHDYEDTGIVLPYELTYRLDIDVDNYFKQVYGWIKNNKSKLKAHQHFKS